MPGKKRQSLLPRRRRHDDEGEDDASVEGDAQEYASTAGSLTSDAVEDGASHVTDEERTKSFIGRLLFWTTSHGRTLQDTEP